MTTAPLPVEDSLYESDRLFQDLHETHLFGPRGGPAVVVGCDPADAEQQANRAELNRLLPWLPVADTLPFTVHHALAALARAASPR